MPNSQMIEVTKMPDGGMLYTFCSPSAQAALEEDCHSFLIGERAEIAGIISSICSRWAIQPKICPAALLFPEEMAPDGACAEAISEALERYAYQHMN